jgi:hypothetical protein
MTNSAADEDIFPIHRCQNSPEGPVVEAILSRPAYRLGETLVGTIRLLPPSSSTAEPRSFFKSAQVYAAGRCKIDSRWHNPEEYKRLYGRHPHLKGYRDIERQVAQESSVCVWATNVVPLMELEERMAGKWSNVKPKALYTIPDSIDELFREEAYKTEESCVEKDHLEKRHLAFTFRTVLPLDMPPSALLTCCRYSYSVVISCTTSSEEVCLFNHVS